MPDNLRVTLDLDTTRALRSLDRQVALVRTIAAAPEGEPETDWVEWKSEADLSKKEWQATLARHVLGFANRLPDRAARSCEGTAYLLVGVEPGRIIGTRVHDVAKINAWLSAYVGSAPDAPEWAATYVRVDDVDLLLITVEPPRWGDPIWTFRKEYAPTGGARAIREGTVFVRRQGSTDQADTKELRALTDRASSAPGRLAVELQLEDDDRGVPVDDSPAVVTEWAEGERESLGGPQVLPIQAAESAEPREADTRAVLDAERKALVFKSSLERFVAETRTPAEYAETVAAFIERGSAALPAALRRGAIAHGLGRLRLWVANLTDRNFTQVMVELHFEQPRVAAYFDRYEVEGPDFPSRPATWGASTYQKAILSSLRPSILNYPVTGLTPRPPRGSIDNSGSSRVRFDPIDIRPDYKHRLPTIYLLVSHDYRGETLTASWSATATNVSGIVGGTIQVPIAPDTPTLGDLLSKTATDDESDA